MQRDRRRGKGGVGAAQCCTCGAEEEKVGRV